MEQSEFHKLAISSFANRVPSLHCAAREGHGSVTLALTVVPKPNFLTRNLIEEACHVRHHR